MNEKKKCPLAFSAIAKNPVLVLFLGACPAMAQTGSVISALGMGVAVLLVMLLSAMLISALRRLIPERAKLPAYVLIVAGFVSIVQLLMNAFLPSVYQMLGVYLAVVAVDLAVFANGEASASRGFGASVLDSLLTGLGFTLALFCMAAVREIFGSGSFAGLAIPFLESHNVPLLLKAPGGFLVFAILLAVIQALRRDDCGCEAGGLACAAAGIAAAPENNEQEGE